MYLDYKKIREFETKIGFEILIKKNIEIGKFLNFEPEIEWMVGTDESSCFHPKSLGYNDANSQKLYAEKWLKEQKEKYPNGWVVTEGNKVIKREYYPSFHTDWNHLIEAIKRLSYKGCHIPVAADDIFYTWQLVYQNCNPIATNPC